MKIAVTGASGHVGNVVCRKLIEKGCKVKAFYNSDSRSLQNLDLELVQGNVLNKSDLNSPDTINLMSCQYLPKV